MNARPTFLLTTIESDAHTWNLVYMRSLLEEHSIHTISLGPCVRAEATVEAIFAHRPDVVVISSVNGHGVVQGRALFQLAARCVGKPLPPLVIGGKLCTRDADEPGVKRDLLALGFSGVFVGAQAIPEFRRWLTKFNELRAELGTSTM
jgi:methylaspartate mutase sigma subunit